VKMRHLQAQFLRYEMTPEGATHQRVDTIEEAQGVRFLCPKCFKKNSGPIGTHSVVCWSRSRGTPNDAFPGPGRWKLEGTHIGDLTLAAEPGQTRSVHLMGGCGWHGFVTKGHAE
jgi:hypothetical protein